VHQLRSAGASLSDPSIAHAVPSSATTTTSSSFATSTACTAATALCPRDGGPLTWTAYMSSQAKPRRHVTRCTCVCGVCVYEFTGRTMEARCTCICGVCVYEFTSQTMEARCTCVCGVCVYMSSQAKPWRHVARAYVVCVYEFTSQTMEARCTFVCGV